MSAGVPSVADPVAGVVPLAVDAGTAVVPSAADPVTAVVPSAVDPVSAAASLAVDPVSAVVPFAGVVGQIACMNRRLHYHPEGRLTPEMLEEVYGCPVELITHGVPHRVLGHHAHE